MRKYCLEKYVFELIKCFCFYITCTLHSKCFKSFTHIYVYYIYQLDLSCICCCTLLIKKESHKWRAIISTLALVWALWAFQIFIWFELHWWSPKEQNKCPPKGGQKKAHQYVPKCFSFKLIVHRTKFQLPDQLWRSFYF